MAVFRLQASMDLPPKGGSYDVCQILPPKGGSYNICRDSPA